MQLKKLKAQLEELRQELIKTKGCKKQQHELSRAIVFLEKLEREGNPDSQAKVNKLRGKNYEK